MSKVFKFCVSLFIGLFLSIVSSSIIPLILSLFINKNYNKKRLIISVLVLIALFYYHWGVILSSLVLILYAFYYEKIFNLIHKYISPKKEMMQLKNKYPKEIIELTTSIDKNIDIIGDNMSNSHSIIVYEAKNELTKTKDFLLANNQAVTLMDNQLYVIMSLMVSYSELYKQALSYESVYSNKKRNEILTELKDITNQLKTENEKTLSSILDKELEVVKAIHNNSKKS